MTTAFRNNLLSKFAARRQVTFGSFLVWGFQLRKEKKEAKRSLEFNGYLSV
jgi:hypothetical protein